MKYLYPYECEKKNLSTPAELQAAIDGNRREGRRSSYGQFDSPSVQRSPIPQGISQMPPLSLVSHVNQQHHQHRLLPPVGQIPNMLPAEFEQRMLNYIKMFQPKEMGRSQSPDKLSALNAIDISRVALWNMYNPSPNSPPNSLNTSPENNMQSALDLSESPDHAMSAIKRERDHPVDFSDARDYGNGLGPPAKRSHHHHHSHHNRSLTPQKLNSSSHDEDDARSDSTPINLRENGSHGRRPPLDDDGDDEEDEMEDETTEEDMLRASFAAAAAAAVNQHPLALSLADHHLQQQQQHQHQQQQQQRERERIQQQVAAHQQQQREQQRDSLATLDLSILDRERLRCDSADKLKRQSQGQQQQQHQQQQQQQQQQQLLDQHHLHQRQLQHQQQSRVARELRKHENGDRLSLTPDSELHHSKGHLSTSGGGAGSDPFSSPLGITGMQFKLISRGDASKGDQKLVVTMEFNGVQYEGVLFANPLSSTNLSAPASTPPSSSVSATSASPICSLVSPVKSSAAHISSPHDERDTAATSVDLASTASGTTATVSTNAASTTNICIPSLDSAGTSPAPILPTATTTATSAIGAVSPARSMVS
uniref:REKLES domain-containing protein n=1 Tax=Anopheles epiroticus TaxID=199890 RepID=A0A182PUN8_9DIPT